MQYLINKYIIWKFKTSNWEKRYRMVESDHNRILDELAVKDQNRMVRLTLAQQRISYSILKELAKDNDESVVRQVIRKCLSDVKIISLIKERNLPFVDECIKTESIKQVIECGRFASLSSYYTLTEEDILVYVKNKINNAKEYGKVI